MSQREGDRKGSVVDPEQPPHVDGLQPFIALRQDPTRQNTLPVISLTHPSSSACTQVVRGIPVGEPLPCGGLGFGWTLFILGFFLGIVPWYIGSVRLLTHKDYRERPGYFACLIAAVIVTVAIIVQLVLNGWIPY
uniref:60S ribosomal protein L18a-like protein n=1 Tax=Kalanchoe fedtschenkoi TaxID=63787 RepID=A0A7N0VEZ0_KALFE